MNRRERKERELAAVLLGPIDVVPLATGYSQLPLFMTLFATPSRRYKTVQLWIDNGYTAAAPHPILRLSKASIKPTACSLLPRPNKSHTKIFRARNLVQCSCSSSPNLGSQVACKLTTCQDKDTYVIFGRKLGWHDEMESSLINVAAETTIMIYKAIHAPLPLIFCRQIYRN